jgi:hypothetical protein
MGRASTRSLIDHVTMPVGLPPPAQQRWNEMPLHPIADKAEVSVEFPDKAYIGSFGRNSQFDAYADADSVAIKLVRPGDDRREAVLHLHYGLLAEILAELAQSLMAREPLDEPHRADLSAAAQRLSTALEPRKKPSE